MNPAQTVLVTGAAGFLGNWTAAALAQDGPTVLTARSFQPGPSTARHAAAPSEHTAPELPLCVAADLSRRADVARLVAGIPQGGIRLVHLAGSHRTTCPNHLFSANVRTLLELLDALGERLNHLTLASSVAVYGLGQGTREGAPRRAAPDTDYGRTKWLAEQAAGLFRAHSGVPVSVLRLASLYGEGGSTNAPGILAERTVSGRPFTIGPLPAARDYLHAEDAARAIRAASVAGHDGTLDIGSGTASTPQELVEVVRALGEHPVTAAAESGGAGAAAGSAFRCDTAPARSALGFRPAVSLSEGLRRTLAWHRRETVEPRGVAR